VVSLAIKCIPPEVSEYTTGSFVVKFGVINEYETTKSCQLEIYRCIDPKCNKGLLVGETDPFDLPPGPHTLEVTLTIEQSGIYLIGVYNITDDKPECAIVIKVSTPMEQMMNAMMGIMPMMLVIPMIGIMANMVRKITER